MSGRKEDVIDLLICQVKRSGSRRPNEGQHKRLPGGGPLLAREFHSLKQELAHSGPFAGSADFQFTVDRIRDVNRGAHKNIIAYLWNAWGPIANRARTL